MIVSGTVTAPAEVELFVAGVPGDRDALEARVSRYRPRGIFEGAVRVMIEFYFEKPRGMLAGHHTDGPRLQELADEVLEVLNGVFILDGRQVCSLITVKGYAETPGVNMKIQAADGPQRKGVVV